MHHMADHPHRHDRFGVSVACLREFAARHGKARNGFGRPSCEHLGEEGQRYKDDGATECSVAEPGVQQVANTDVERQPRKIEQCDRAQAGQEGPHAVEVTKRL